MRPRRLLVGLVGVLLIAIALAGAFILSRARATSGQAADRRDCGEVYGDLADIAESTRTKIFSRPEPTPGWEIVNVAGDRDGTWEFVDDGSGAPRGVRSEGAFTISDDPDGLRIDMTTFDASREPGEGKRRERMVLIGNRLWIEDAEFDERVECEAPGHVLPLLRNLEQALGAAPYLDRVAQGGRDWAAPNIGPGLTVLAKVVSTEEVDGVTMTTYEQHPVERYEQIRTRFTLDADGQLRWAEAVDTTTGKVLYQRTARPAPDHPPIEDPSGQPIIGMTP